MQIPDWREEMARGLQSIAHATPTLSGMPQPCAVYPQPHGTESGRPIPGWPIKRSPNTCQHASAKQRSIAAAFQHCVRPRIDRSGILRPGIRPRRRWKQCWRLCMA